MATKPTTAAAQEAATAPAPRIVKCRVAVNKLELPHGIARGEKSSTSRKTCTKSTPTPGK